MVFWWFDDKLIYLSWFLWVQGHRDKNWNLCFYSIFHSFTLFRMCDWNIAFLMIQDELILDHVSNVFIMGFRYGWTTVVTNLSQGGKMKGLKWQSNLEDWWREGFERTSKKGQGGSMGLNSQEGQLGICRGRSKEPVWTDWRLWPSN